MFPIQRILVANRGEIACRVFRSAHEMGIGTAAVFTDDDLGSPHARSAETSIHIDDYLSIESILAAAKESGADAIHPGYGFLSESAALSQACIDAGLRFIGPSPKSMLSLGDKAAAREIAMSIGIPVAEGFGPFSDADEIAKAATLLGAPLMLKAASGGGGKGMKRLLELADLNSQIESSQRETKAAFGDDRLIVERYIEPARHIEVQIFGDGTRAIALGERECSLQRRHQKLIEESPSTAIDDALRQDLFDSARRIAEAVGYSNAGTVEFLLGPSGGFYFLEVNTRLQVEHPVTELCTGLDLVRMQIEIAGGLPMIEQKQVRCTGHAIEARLNAEDPYKNFMPSAGRVLLKHFPDSVRIDTGLGDFVATRYDSLIAKIIAHGDTREEARQALCDALRETAVLGVYTNQTFLLQLLESDAFRDGQTFTSTVDSIDIGERPVPPEIELAAALVFQGPNRTAPVPWQSHPGWRIQ